MDRQLSPQIIRQRKIKFILRTGLTLLAFILIITLLVNVFKPGVRAKDIMISTVDQGTLEISIYSSGKVVPLSEEIITSPLSSKILEIYKKAGEQVKKGEPIIQLDLEAFNTEYETKREELALKHSKLEQQRTASQGQLDEMKMQIEINEMKLKRMAVLLANERYLDSIGASTTDKVKQEELNYNVEQLQLKQQKQKYQNQLKAAQVEINGLELDYRIATKNLNLMKKTQGEAQIRSPKDATLTYVNDQIGTSVSQGSQLAIVSDFSHFKIEADIADNYADKILSGNKVTVQIGKEKLSGIVGNVSPSVQNGTIRFNVSLTDPDHARLRPGLKVDVHVIHGLKDDVLRLNSGSYYIGPGEYDLWVIDNGIATRRKITLGESSFEYVEVIQGLQKGEQVIISDMNRYQNKNTLKIIENERI